MAYDSESDRVIMFGGFNFPSEVMSETWTYDFNTLTWTNLSLAGRPSARYAHATAYDAQSDRLVLFGGSLTSGATADTWLFHYGS